MKSLIGLIAIVALMNGILFSQDIPFATSPDWESAPDGQIATGLGLADINGDGWKDLVVANGNDIQLQRLSVYHNLGDGTFSDYPDWESADIDYHGHLSVGDIDKDGWVDVAVSVYIGPGGFSEPGKVKVYYNTGGELESNPSFESYEFYTFSCALGDADGDGDLDLATTGGEPYSSLYDEGKIFMNRNGQFNEQPDWSSSLAFGSLDVDFGDVDQNGYLDLIFGSEDTPNYIFLADESGNIFSEPGWQSSEPSNYINSLDFGLLGVSNYPGVVMTGNDQLGGDGKVRMYDFSGGVPSASTAAWSSNYFGYGSGILLADVDLDGINDLIYGGWWLPVKIALGDEDGFELNPSYTSSTSSVVEAIQLADLNRDGIEMNTLSLTITNDNMSVVYLEHQLVENILQVSLNGKTITPAFYTFVPNKNWISFKDPLINGDELVIEYEYSNKPDMVITNWDSQKGNYIFYNQGTSGNQSQKDSTKEDYVRISPNPVDDELAVSIKLSKPEVVKIGVFSVSGKDPVARHQFGLLSGWNRVIIKTDELDEGSYIVKVKMENRVTLKKFIKI